MGGYGTTMYETERGANAAAEKAMVEALLLKLAEQQAYYTQLFAELKTRMSDEELCAFVNGTKTGCDALESLLAQARKEELKEIETILIRISDEWVNSMTQQGIEICLDAIIARMNK